MGRRIPGGNDEGGFHPLLVPGFHGPGGVSADGGRDKSRFVLRAHDRIQGSETKKRRVWVRFIAAYVHRGSTVRTNRRS